MTDFCWAGVGAIATRLLADFGAEVIRIEDRERVCMTRRVPLYKGAGLRPHTVEDIDPDVNRSGVFNNYNRNKLGIALDMRSARGRELAERLIARSDVLTENFAPGVMERWGLTNERVREINPAIIYARMSGFGHSGPHATYKSYGPVVQAVSGLSHISGLPGREPSGWGLSYMDNQAAYYNSVALLAALLARRRHGVATDVDVSAVEAGVELIGPLLMDVAVNGRSTRGADFPIGNRCAAPAVAPHGVYPCAGTDRWIAIVAFDDDEWAALCRGLGDPPWAQRPEFATISARVAHQDELDAALAAVTCSHDRHELMHRLQALGVRAAAVQDARDVNEHDPQMAHRQVFFELDHPVIGEARFEGVPFTADAFAPDHWRSAPLLGEDGRHVARAVLELDEDEIDELAAEGVL